MPNLLLGERRRLEKCRAAWKAAISVGAYASGGDVIVFGRVLHGRLLVAHYVNGTLHYHPTYNDPSGEVTDIWEGSPLGRLRPSESVFLRYKSRASRRGTHLFYNGDGVILGPLGLM